MIFGRHPIIFNKSLMRTQPMRKSCELELGAARLVEVEKADADKAAEIALAPKGVDGRSSIRGVSEEEAASERRGRRQPRGPPPSGQFDQDMEVIDGLLVLADDVRNARSADEPVPIEDIED
ncbi:hypothetical protein ACSQ67_000644 [Phaseolus vulgaris]